MAKITSEKKTNCTGCPHLELKKAGKGEAIPADNYCSHNLAPNSLRKLTPLHTGNGAFIGYNDNTPEWCPIKPSEGKKIKGKSTINFN